MASALLEIHVKTQAKVAIADTRTSGTNAMGLKFIKEVESSHGRIYMTGRLSHKKSSKCRVPDCDQSRMKKMKDCLAYKLVDSLQRNVVLRNMCHCPTLQSFA